MTLSRGAQRCLELLRDYSRKHRGRVFPFQATLAKHLGKTDRQVRNYLSELKEAGLVQVHKQGQTSATYEVSIGQLQVVENKSDGKENFRSVSGLFPVCGVPVSITYSSTELQEQARARETTKLGNSWPDDLPVESLRRLRCALRDASGRIAEANNPAAYERGVIQRELAANGGQDAGSRRRSEGAAPTDSCLPLAEERTVPVRSEPVVRPMAQSGEMTSNRTHAAVCHPPETQRKPPLPCLEWVAAVDADVGALAARKGLR